MVSSIVISWTSEDLSRLPSRLVMDIVLNEYERGRRDHALELLRQVSVQYPTPEHGVRLSDFKEALVMANDVEALNQLSVLAPNWYPEKTMREAGGVCMAVVSRNASMLEMLLQSKSKIDGMSAREVERFLTVHPDPKMLSRIKNYDMYESRSALSWAVIMEDLDSIKMLLQSEERIPLWEHKTESSSYSGSRHSSRQVFTKDSWGDIVKWKLKEIAQFLFAHPTYHQELLQRILKISDRNRTFPQDVFFGLDLLTMDQQKQVWDALEKQGSPIPGWFQDSHELRTPLVKGFPEKYVQYLNQFGMEPPKSRSYFSSSVQDQGFYANWKLAIECGAVEIVKALAGLHPEWMVKTWEDYPAATRHTKRQRGPLSLALTANQPAIVDWLVTQPGVLENEKKSLVEYFAKGWMKPERSMQNLSAEEERERLEKQTKSIHALWEKIQLQEMQTQLLSPSKIHSPRL